MKNIMSKFQIGQKVARAAFTDCFGNKIPKITNLTVESVKLIECKFIPSYFRVKAIDKTGGYYEGAELFFEAL